MELVRSPTEQRVLLRNVSWETYQRLIVLPPLTTDVLARFIEEGLTTGRPAWVREVRQWVRDRPGRPESGDA